MTGKKKDFSSIITTPVYNAIADATADVQEVQEAKPKRKPRRTYTEQEAAAALEKMQTAGMKGVRLARINMAFSPSNYDFVVTMSRVTGQNLTQFVNKVMDEYRAEHKDIYDKALEFRKML